MCGIVGFVDNKPKSILKVTGKSKIAKGFVIFIP